MKTYTIVYTNEGEMWLAEAKPDTVGLFTQGKTIKQARERLLEVIQLVDGEQEDVLLQESIYQSPDPQCGAV